MMQQGALAETALIVLNYNTPAMTLQAVRHLQSFGSALRIILVDNCSTDASREEFAATFGIAPEEARVGARFVRGNVHLLFNDVNRGYAHGNNVGVDYVVGLGDVAYIGIMNPDVVVNEDVLLALTRALGEHDEIGLITAKTYYKGVLDEYNHCAWRANTARHFLWQSSLFGYLCMHLLPRFGFNFAPHGDYHLSYYGDRELAYVDVVQGCFFMSRLATFLKAGKFDEHTFLYCEEDILYARMRDIGKRNAVLPRYTIRHDHQEKEAGLAKRKPKLFHRTCLFESQDYYIANYYQGGFLEKLLLRALMRFYHNLRRLGIYLLYSD